MARRTFRYSSTVKMPPPSLTPERAKVAEFYSAGSGTIPPLPWQTFPPPFSDGSHPVPSSEESGRTGPARSAKGTVIIVHSARVLHRKTVTFRSKDFAE